MTVEEAVHLIFQMKTMVSSTIMICLLYNRLITICNGFVGSGSFSVLLSLVFCC